MYPPGSSPEESQISIFRSTSDDFLQWSEPELVLSPEQEGLDSLRDRAVSLRFHLREADLYAFWFQPHAGGAPR